MLAGGRSSGDVPTPGTRQGLPAGRLGLRNGLPAPTRVDRVLDRLVLLLATAAAVVLLVGHRFDSSWHRWRLDRREKTQGRGLVRRLLDRQIERGNR